MKCSESEVSGEDFKTMEATNKLLNEQETSSISQIEEYVTYANLSAKDYNGNTALHIALKAKHRDERRIGNIVTLLIQAGADVDSLNKSKETPLVWAIWLGLLFVAKVLIKFEANVNIRVEGATLQHFAAASSYPRSLEFLWQNLKADFEVVDDEGKTPLMIAAERNLNIHIKWLIKHGVDLSTKDRAGETALFYAVRSNKRKALWALLEVAPYTQLEIKNNRDENIVAVARMDDGPLYKPLKRLEDRQKKCCRSWFDEISGNIYRLESRRWTAFKWKIVLIGLQIIIILQAVLYFRKHYQYYTVLLLCLIGLGNILYVRLFKMDPGYIKTTVGESPSPKGRCIQYTALLIPPHVAQYEEACLLATEDKVCVTCKCVVPLRSKHCKEFDRCVDRYDHYCPFIDTAVGHGNRISFIFFLIWWLIVFSWYAYLSYVLWCELLEDIETLDRHSVELAIFGVGGVGCLFLGIFCLSLLFTHLYLVGVNLTTNEWLNYTKYEYLIKDGRFSNQFDRGCFRNCYTFWCQRNSTGSIPMKEV